MKTTMVFLISFILFVNSSYSQNFQWAQSPVTSMFAQGNGVSTDAAGNLYTTGSFMGTLNFNGQILTSSTTQEDMFISKYNSSGFVQWVKKGGGASADRGICIATDLSGSSYVAGEFNNTAAFESINLTAMHLNDIFIAKYNSSGNVLWAIDACYSTDYMKVSDISVNVSGDCYVTGFYSGTLNISSTTLISSGLSDVFIAKFNSSGDLIWAKSGGGNGRDAGNSISTDNLGNVFLTGSITDDANFGSVAIIINPDDTLDAFIVKYNSSGVAQWGKFAGGTGAIVGNGISADNLGNCFVTGTFMGTAALGTHIITSSGKNDIFTAMCNTSGNFNWVKKGGTSNSDFVSDIKTDDAGNSYITGNYYGTITFDAFTLTPPGGALFIVKYDKFGEVSWIKSAGGAAEVSSVNSKSIISDFAGNVYIAGYYYGSVSFGTYVNMSSSQNVFLAKLSNEYNLITGSVFIDYNNDGIKNGADVPYNKSIISYTPGPNNTLADLNGYYGFLCGSGSFNLSIPNIPLYHTSNPASHNVFFSGFFNANSNNNFGLYPNPGINDLRISLTPGRRFVSGFDETHYITYSNIGTTVQSGYVELLYDNRLTLLSTQSIPPPDFHSGNVARWNFTNLNTFVNNVKTIKVVYNVPAGVSVGSILSSTATVTPVAGDYTPADNSALSNHQVYNSHDPNDKSVEPSGNLTLQQLSTAKYLTYTVRFQNTGTNVAYTVSVLDKLSSKLDIATLEILSSSHDYIYSIAADGTVDWTFNNILLPDKTTNELGSNGFIKYRIKPKNNVVVGDEIMSTANIYFDYNDAVITNTTNTKIVAPIKWIDMRFKYEAMTIPDSLMVLIRNSTPPYAIVDSAKIIPNAISAYYKGIAGFVNAQTGVSYYIIAKHRNSIETWSANPVALNSDTTVYDFTTSLSKAFGSNMKLISGLASFFSGDENQDGKVDLLDIIHVFNDAAIFKMGYSNTDLDGSAFVDLSDLLIAFNNSATFVHVINP